eukprot:6192371-Pleurochrysis_carterae.AAC.2
MQIGLTSTHAQHTCALKPTGQASRCYFASCLRLCFFVPTPVPHRHLAAPLRSAISPFGRLAWRFQSALGPSVGGQRVSR